MDIRQVFGHLIVNLESTSKMIYANRVLDRVRGAFLMLSAQRVSLASMGTYAWSNVAKAAAIENVCKKTDNVFPVPRVTILTAIKLA